MRLFGQAPPPLTFAQQMEQQRLANAQQLQQQRLTGSQQLSTQQQQDAAARQQAQIAASQAASSAFYSNIQAQSAGNQDLIRGVAERSAAWLQPRVVQQDSGSNLGLILGITGGAAVLVLLVILLVKR